MALSDNSSGVEAKRDLEDAARRVFILINPVESTL